MEINPNAGAPVIMPALPEGGREPPRDAEVANAVREGAEAAGADNGPRPDTGGETPKDPADTRLGSRLDVTA